MKIAVVLQRDPFSSEKGTYLRYKANLRSLMEICYKNNWKLDILLVSSSQKLMKTITSSFDKKEQKTIKITNIPQVELIKTGDSDDFFHKFANIYLKNPFLTLRTAASILKDTDIVIFFEPYNQMLLAVLGRLHRRKCVFDFQNSESMLGRSILTNAHSLRDKLLGLAWYSYGIVTESLLLKMANRIAVPGKADIDSLIESHGASNSKRLVVIPNVVDIPPDADSVFYTSSPEKKDVLFVGDMSYQPNRQATEIIINHVAPELQQKSPQAYVCIVGRSPPQMSNVPSNVQILGYVPNLSEVTKRCVVAIAPLYAGAGIKYKILTYLLYGLPVVATPKAVEGLDDEIVKFIDVVTKPEDFAKAVIHIVDDHEDRVERCKKAREYVLREYTMTPSFMDKWEGVIQELVKG
jgi:glycosyltransferase involved in cell wall biosynthesis